MTAPRIDNLQYCRFGPDIFAQLRAGGVDAIHVTIAYHESFREMVLNLEQWNRWFEAHPDLIFKGLTAHDVTRAQETGRTAVVF
ncbi:MAG: membrane dipeptidase, partial [Pseudomonadota bacterium]